MENTEKLTQEVKEAQTPTSQGRQTVANNCKKLYNIIESALFRKYGEDAIKDAYADLCQGNFAEPFMCEQKKEKYLIYETIYRRIASS